MTGDRLLGIRPLTAGLLCAYLAGFVACSVVVTAMRGADGTHNVSDFDVFWLAGRLILEGRAATAYDFEAFEAYQVAVSGTVGTLPYAYPPPFGLLAGALAAMSAHLAFAALTGLSTAAVVAVLVALGGRHWGGVLLTILPALLAGMLNGQTGALCAALAGLSAWSLLEGRARGGVALGLLVLKPHVAVGFGLVALLGGAWRAAAVALGTAAALCGAATLAFGPGIWAAFLDGVATSGDLLARGSFPLDRMVSVYALARSAGLPADVALGIHAAAAVAATGVAVAAWRAGWAPRRALALAVVASLAASPYLYDYDLAVLGVALALAAPDLARAPRVAGGVLALAWAAGIYPYAAGWLTYQAFLRGEDVSLAARPIAWGGLAAALLGLVLVATLRRAEAAGRAAPVGAAA